MKIIELVCIRSICAQTVQTMKMYISLLEDIMDECQPKNTNLINFERSAIEGCWKGWCSPPYTCIYVGWAYHIMRLPIIICQTVISCNTWMSYVLLVEPRSDCETIVLRLPVCVCVSVREDLKWHNIVNSQYIVIALYMRVDIP